MKISRHLRALIRAAIIAELGYRPVEISVGSRYDTTGDKRKTYYNTLNDDGETTDLFDLCELKDLKEIEGDATDMVELDCYIYDEDGIDTNVGVYFRGEKVLGTYQTATPFEERDIQRQRILSFGR